MRAIAAGVAAAVAVAGAAAAWSPPAVNAQPPVRKVAVAETTSEVVMDWEAAALFPTILAAALREVSGGRLLLVDGRLVRTEMARRGWTSHELISLSNAAALGRAVDADVVVTWRFTYFDVGTSGSGTGSTTRPLGGGGRVETVAAVYVRALEVATRRRLVEGEFSGAAFGQPRYD
ncbi:MAG: hypothetical protein HY660_03225, partial [Armatimonadetes bacterium]|nr:hypothetical protein [Armatimonadota bacterium]